MSRDRDLKVEYTPNHSGVRQLGLGKVATKAAGQAASRVVSAANSLDPKGNYSAKQVGMYVGKRNEPRNGVVVEGEWYPGATNRALVTALEQAVRSFK